MANRVCPGPQSHESPHNRQFHEESVIIMYIDPNTGGVLFQVLAGLLAAISGVLFFFSRSIRQWVARLRRRTRKEEDDQ